MDRLDVLTDGFPGNESWSSFVDVFRPAWATVSDKEGLVHEIGNEDIAIVLHATMGYDAITWIKQPIPALGNQSVVQVFKAGSRGEIAVKSLIMRMPR